MTSGTPLRAASEIFNLLSGMTPDEPGAVEQCVIRLTRPCRTMPGDFLIRVALAESLLLCGDRDSALEQIDIAFQIRDSSDFAAISRLHVILFNTGQEKRAREIVEQTYFDQGRRAIAGAMDNVALFALWSGDIELLERAAEAAEDASQDSTFPRSYLEAIHATGIRDWIGEHQRVVVDMVRNHQTWVTVTMDCTDGTLPFMTIQHDVALNREDRMELDRSLHDALWDLYGNRGVTPSVIAPYFHNVLRSAPIRHVLKVA